MKGLASEKTQQSNHFLINKASVLIRVIALIQFLNNELLTLLSQNFGGYDCTNIHYPSN